jgi:hypothetical protein
LGKGMIGKLWIQTDNKMDLKVKVQAKIKLILTFNRSLKQWNVSDGEV